MYITTIYSKLSPRQKKKVNNFLKEHFNDDDSKITNFELEPETIIILVILDNKIVGTLCLYDNKFLIEKLNRNNIPLSFYSINNSHGCFIYNLCVHKNYRNKKIGYGLLQYSLTKMAELNIDYLHTQAENEISQILFLKNGFMEDNVFNKHELNKKIYVMSKYL
jgi:ribosomal protein S18 acetylase RimI-like enzyme